MAIYHLSHKSIGRSTHAAGTAGAHLSYITRTSACREVLGSDMPVPAAGERGGAARAWLDKQEEADRKNARVVDKVTIALPIELDATQRVELVRAFAAEVTQGRVPWLAAIHDQGKDAENPHAHVVLRDRDLETGKMALRMSQSGSTEMLRETWERVCNAALERAGSDERIDRRTLEAQGIEREPSQHIGPVAQAIEEDGRKSWKLEALREAAQKATEAAQRATEAREAAQRATEAREAAQRATEAREAAQRATEAAQEVLDHEIAALFDASAPPPLEAGMPHLEAHQIMERRDRDRVYQAGLMSQDRAILRDPEFRSFHAKMVKGSALKGTIDFIRSEAKMYWLGPSRTEQAAKWITEAQTVYQLNRKQTTDALNEIRHKMARLTTDLHAARDWLAGKLPNLRHCPPSLADVVEHWRKRDPTKISEAEALGALSPEVAVAEAISNVRGHWGGEVKEIEDVFPAAQNLEQKLVNRVATLDHEAKPQAARYNGSERK